MQDTPSAKTTTRTAQIAVDAELVAQAEAAGLDVAREVEKALRRAIAAEGRAKVWQAENREAIEANNRYFEQNGLPLAKYRTW
jgi:antitoxin CcdA